MTERRIGKYILAALLFVLALSVAAGLAFARLGL
jgi:hypothetical protein